MAYTVTPHDITTPYEVLELGQDFSERQFITGELDGYPEMVELTTDTDTTIGVTLLAMPDDTNQELSGMVVRVLQPRGVQEVARLKPADATWAVFREPVSKLNFLAGPETEVAVASGTYRIEVSTPENFGKYVLVVGNGDARSGYLATWRSVAALYEFMGVSKLVMIRTPLVYYPFGILLLLAGLSYTVYRTRERLPFLRRYG